MIRKLVKKDNEEFAPDELELLNLIAELITEIIIKETEEGDHQSDVKAR